MDARLCLAAGANLAYEEGKRLAVQAEMSGHVSNCKWRGGCVKHSKLTPGIRLKKRPRSKTFTSSKTVNKRQPFFPGPIQPSSASLSRFVIGIAFLPNGRRQRHHPPPVPADEEARYS